MSYQTLTPVQRAALVRACQRVAQSAHRATQDYRAVGITDEHPRDDEYVEIDALIAELKVVVDQAVA